jgi:hypothetical protein
MELRERGARGREGEEIVWRCKYAKAYKSQWLDNLVLLTGNSELGTSVCDGLHLRQDRTDDIKLVGLVELGILPRIASQWERSCQGHQCYVF